MTKQALEPRKALRQQIRQARQALTPQQQQAAAQSILKQVKIWFNSHCHQQPIKNVAIYLANDGELNTHLIIDWLWQQNITVYLPVLHPFTAGHLLFLQYQKDEPLILNKFGISEPQLSSQAICPVKELDVVFTPLVAFDQQGQRLGMGGGYYDRTFAFSLLQPQTKPLLVGLAHDCQYLPSLPNQAWDVPLPTIITPSEIFSF
ncbi:5-formyltetrahydrofolate cyclo-ligase [Saccharobesus litoralis]|uniref:5-formyltetrahydrofolate cyclo-ligase n=1 Tax=Saccharobesus litoralis TaxID=2172099 RepID=A0A2S0VRY8_9ALTE|nr:5-formyltetrahydrofolate cyclo-ligase [Saccharobesus litoralis]AWB66985.1 5-formyltetrahydrofolate cyclo-ligase [Saccharobesus litoralis]